MEVSVSRRRDQELTGWKQEPEVKEMRGRRRRTAGQEGEKKKTFPELKVKKEVLD